MVLSCFRCRDNQARGALYQDGKYGKGMRIHNRTRQKSGTRILYRCTICGNERTASQ